MLMRTKRLLTMHPEWVQKQRKIFSKRSREKRGTVSREVSRERNVLEGHMDEEGQKYMAAYCSDRYTES